MKRHAASPFELFTGMIEVPPIAGACAAAGGGGAALLARNG